MERKQRGFRATAPSAEAVPHRRHSEVRAKGQAPEIGLWEPLNLAQRCARVIAALKLAGEDEALVQFIQPIDLAIHSAQPTAVTHNEPLDSSPAAPTREMAQTYLNQIYQDIEQRAARRTTLGGGAETSPGTSRVG